MQGATACRDQQFPLQTVSGYRGLKRLEPDADYSLVSRAGHTNNPQNNTDNNRTTQITNNVEECGPCPVFASFTLAFPLQLRKKHGNPTVMVGKTPVRLIKTSVSVQYTYLLRL
jgi:hypothetical protein